MSNDLYCNDIASSQELAKGYNRPVYGSEVVFIPTDIKEARAVLQAKRKLNKILRRKAIKTPRIRVGDLVQIFLKKQNEKRGKWSEAKPVLKFHVSSETVTVSGKSGRYQQAAL